MRRWGLIVIFVLLMVCLFAIPSGFAKQGSKTITREPAKNKEASSKEENTRGNAFDETQTVQWMSIEEARKGKIPLLKRVQEYQQTWCLEHEGLMNVVLSDKSICGCLTEIQAVEFASEENWPEALGSVLYHALITDKEPGIVLFYEKDEHSPYILLLDTVIKNYALPITVWKQEINASADKKAEQAQQVDRKQSETSRKEKLPKKDEDTNPFLLNEPQLSP